MKRKVWMNRKSRSIFTATPGIEEQDKCPETGALSLLKQAQRVHPDGSLWGGTDSESYSVSRGLRSRCAPFFAICGVLQAKGDFCAWFLSRQGTCTAKNTHVVTLMHINKNLLVKILCNVGLQLHAHSHTCSNTPQLCETTQRTVPVSTVRVKPVSFGSNSGLPAFRCSTRLKAWPLLTIKRSSPFCSVWWLLLLFLMSRSHHSISNTLMDWKFKMVKIK